MFLLQNMRTAPWLIVPILAVSVLTAGWIAWVVGRQMLFGFN